MLIQWTKRIGTRLTYGRRYDVLTKEGWQFVATFVFTDGDSWFRRDSDGVRYPVTAVQWLKESAEHEYQHVFGQAECGYPGCGRTVDQHKRSM
jgi:hypothetical protein